MFAIWHSPRREERADSLCCDSPWSGSWLVIPGAWSRRRLGGWGACRGCHTRANRRTGCGCVVPLLLLHHHHLHLLLLNSSRESIVHLNTRAVVERVQSLLARGAKRQIAQLPDTAGGDATTCGLLCLFCLPLSPLILLICIATASVTVYDKAKNKVSWMIAVENVYLAGRLALGTGR